MSWTQILATLSECSLGIGEYSGKSWADAPNTDNIGLTAGFTFNASDNLSIDVSYLQIIGLERESEYEPANFGGKYKASSSIPGIGVNYKF